MPGETISSWLEGPTAFAGLGGSAVWAEGPAAIAQVDGLAEGVDPAG